jgi:hypothetical protein
VLKCQLSHFFRKTMTPGQRLWTHFPPPPLENLIMDSCPFPFLLLAFPLSVIHYFSLCIDLLVLFNSFLSFFILHYSFLCSFFLPFFFQLFFSFGHSFFLSLLIYYPLRSFLPSVSSSLIFLIFLLSQRSLFFHSFSFLVPVPS